eukprot:g15811.t1
MMRTEQFLIAAPATTMLPSCAFEELQAEAKAKADKAKKVFEEKLKEEKKKLAEKQKAEKERLEHELKSKKLKERIKIMKDPLISLYCWALMMPFGYEAGLLLEQKRQGVGIFECDEWAVYSNQSMMSDGNPFPFPVHEVKGPNGEPISLFVPLGGRWHTALNRAPDSRQKMGGFSVVIQCPQKA